MSDCSTNVVEAPEKTCRFALEVDRDWYGKAEAGRVRGPREMRLAWTCSHCGIQFMDDRAPFPPEWMQYCPGCGWKVMRA